MHGVTMKFGNYVYSLGQETVFNTHNTQYANERK